MGIISKLMTGAGAGVQKAAAINWEQIKIDADREWRAKEMEIERQYQAADREHTEARQDQQRIEDRQAAVADRDRAEGRQDQLRAEDRANKISDTADDRKFQRELETMKAKREAAKASWGNPVDELGADGKPQRVQYANNGQRRVIEGAQPMSKDGAAGKMTEQQSKDLVFYTRGSSALSNLDQHAGALTSPVDAAMGKVPAVGNAMVSTDYQQGEQAGREFLAAVLRKDSGAALTAQEMREYGRIYLPQPFDSEEVLQQKAQARTTALQAIRSGLGSAASLAPPEPARSSTQAPQITMPKVGEVDGGYRFKGGDPSNPSSWEAVR